MGKQTASKPDDEKGNKRKKVLVRIQDSLQDVTYMKRIERRTVTNSSGDEVYQIVFVAVMFAEETIYSWTGYDEAERHRDEEYSELEARLEDVGYEII